MKHKIAIVAAQRSAIGSYQGSLKSLSAADMGAQVIQGALKASPIPKDNIGAVFLGQVYTAGVGPNPARIASIKAGLPYPIPATTINMVCGSGMQSIVMGAQSIALGEHNVVIVGGMESMSNTPYVLDGAKEGLKMGHQTLKDTLISDALWDPFFDIHMGITAENLAAKYDISREEQDAYAALSQQRTEQALDHSVFRDEIVNLEIPSKKETKSFQVDEYPRKSVTAASLSNLKPCFKKDGTVTAGNASGLNDGSAILILADADYCAKNNIKPLAYLRDWASIGVDPQIMGIGPAFAIKKLLEKAQLQIDQIDLFEINEAFAAQVLSVLKELDLTTDNVNVNGGAIALGHPLAASGARISVTLIYEMIKRSSQYGIASLCIGGGMGIAMLLEGAE